MKLFFLKTPVVLCSVLLATLFISCACSDSSPGYGSTIDQTQILTMTGGGGSGGGLLEVPESWVTAAGITELMKTRAEEYRVNSISTERGRNGVYVYSTTINKYQNAPAKLAARIAVLGFKDVYLSAGKAQLTSADSWLRTFISTLSGYGVATYAIRLSDIKALVDETLVNDDVALIKNYNAAVSASERFAGISADLEPHIAKAGAPSYPAGLAYTWDSATNYGIGGDNDNLLRLTLERLTKAGNALRPTLGLNEAIFHNFQPNFNEGKLMYGSVPQFLACCDWVIIMAYINSKESVWQRSEPCLKATTAPNSVSICIKAHVNTNPPDNTTLQPEGWNYLIETVKYLLEKGLDEPSFRGIDMFTYEGIETMWEWLNDKN